MTSIESALDSIKQTVGPRGYTDETEAMAPYMADWRGGFAGDALLVVMPASTDEVAAVVRACARAGLAIVPQGGNTGLVRGGIPPTADDGGNFVLISLRRMTAITDIDATGFTMTVEAGAPLQSIQEAAAGKDRLFPLSLAAEGSCQIGGNIATNAGGIHVLRYGNTRDLVLGLEVVLPSGEVWDGLSLLRKDNTGYDLKQLFIGAEGSLGIITRASLKLFPAPKGIETAFVGFDRVEDALELLQRVREKAGDHLVAFEIFPRQGLNIVMKHIEGTRDPLSEPHKWYSITELWAANANQPLREALEDVLDEAAGDGLVTDATMVVSGAQRKAIWKLRESFAEALRAEAMYSGSGMAFDVSVPVAAIPEFIAKTNAELEALIPGILTVPFGHAGDGNIHCNIAPTSEATREAFLAKKNELYRLVHESAVSFGGSISAEHGIGRLRRNELAHYKNPLAMAMMRDIKATLDPDGIMNPGVIV